LTSARRAGKTQRPRSACLLRELGTRSTAHREGESRDSRTSTTRTNRGRARSLAFTHRHGRAVLAVGRRHQARASLHQEVWTLLQRKIPNEIMHNGEGPHGKIDARTALTEVARSRTRSRQASRRKERKGAESCAKCGGRGRSKVTELGSRARKSVRLGFHNASRTRLIDPGRETRR